MDLNSDDLHDDRLEEFKEYEGSKPGEANKKSSAHSFQMRPNFNERLIVFFLTQLLVIKKNRSVSCVLASIYQSSKIWTEMHYFIPLHILLLSHLKLCQSAIELNRKLLRLKSL